MGATYVPWKSEEVESLTLDWLDRKGFFHLYVGVRLGYSIF
jgi:hypothetical protein